MIHINIFIRALIGLNLLIEQKLKRSPNGRAKTSVSANSLTVVPKPTNRSRVTLTNVSILFHRHYIETEAEITLCLNYPEIFLFIRMQE